MRDKELLAKQLHEDTINTIRISPGRASNFGHGVMRTDRLRCALLLSVRGIANGYGRLGCRGACIRLCDAQQSRFDLSRIQRERAARRILIHAS